MKKYLELVEVKGIIQVGSSCGQEVNLLEQFTRDIILIEPLPQCIKLLKSKYQNHIIIETALGFENREQKFYVASNGGESSSILKPKQHLDFYPGITFNKTIKVNVQRFDDVVKNLKIDVSKYNVIISDTQGCDLDALKGFGGLLNSFDLIISEYINTELYEGNQSLNLLKEFLSKDFDLIETFDENLGAGNAVFKRNKN